MMTSQKPSQDTLTYFGPLKEENLPSSSNVLQIVYKFFNLKRENVKGKSKKSKDEQNRKKEDGSDIMRPNVLNVGQQKQASKRKFPVLPSHYDPGSEVELRLRTLSSILKDVPKFMKGSNLDQTYGTDTSPNPSTSELRQYWMPDEKCHECYECGERFTTFRRRHHCRICGQIFCSRCCNQLISGEFMGYSGPLRSCTFCCKWVLTFAQGNAAKPPSSFGNKPTSPSFETAYDDFSRDAISAPDSLLSQGSNGVVQQSSSNTSLRRHSQSSVKLRHDGQFSDESQFYGPGLPSQVLSPGKDMFGRKQPVDIFDATPDLVGPPVQVEDKINDLVQDSSQLHQLWRKINDEKTGVEFRDHRLRLRKYSSCVTGQELVDWLVQNDVAATRVQACGIGQALYDGKWLKAVTDIGGVFQDGYVLLQRGKKPAINTGGDKIEIFPDHFADLPEDQVDGDGVLTLSNQEPIWVQEIKCEEEDEDGEEEFYDAVAESDKHWVEGHHNLDDSHIYSDDERSVSEKSILSLSSFVEIDEDNDVIKYTRPGNMSSAYSGHSRVLQSPQPVFEDSCLNGISADYLRSFLTWHTTYLSQPWITPTMGWRESSLQSSCLPTRDKRAYHWLRETSMRHCLSFLKQLLHDKGLDQAWADVLVPLAKHATEHITPDPDVNIDICHYVQIKKLLDGPRAESQVINGVVCTKNVVHKHMRMDISDPAILLLAIPLEYQRVQLKLSTLDPIVRQEQEFYKHLVSRITSRNPEVVLVQCTVSHLAQKLLLEAGITLVINVKQSVMERVARSTEADIVYSIDQLLQAKLGTCSRFYIQHHCVPSPAFGAHRRNEFYNSSIKTLMYFDGCKPVRGCTIILRQAHDMLGDEDAVHELEQVEEVLQFLLQAMYHAKLETSYLIDHQEFGSRLRKKNTKAPSYVASDSSLTKMLVEHVGSFADSVSSPQTNSDCNELNTGNVSTEGSDLSTPTRSPCQKKIMSDSSPLTDVGESPSTLSVTSPSHPSYAAFELALSKSLLSTSSLIIAQLPYLYSSAGSNSTMHHYLPKKLFWSRKMSENKEFKLIDSDLPKERTSLRSRTNTNEGLTQEKMWLSPAHQRPEYDGDDASLDSLGPGSNALSKDGVDESMANPLLHSQRQQSSFYSQHYRFHTGEQKSSSSDSHSSSNATLRLSLRLNIWEQKLMDQVFGDLSPTLTENQDQQAHGVRVGIKTPSVDELEPSHSSNTVKGRRGEDLVAISPIKYPRFDDFNKKEDVARCDFISHPLVHPASSTETRNLLADFRANIGVKTNKQIKRITMKSGSEMIPGVHRLEETVVRDQESSFPFYGGTSTSPGLNQPDCFDPINHQHIHVLYSSYSSQSPNAPYPCVSPWVVDIDFYRGNDVTLGGFLERYCFRPSYHCPHTNCSRPMVEHVRSFVHGNMCLLIILKELSKPFQQSSILTWNWNHITKKSSEIKAMSHDVWSMSFAKYLELRLENMTLHRPSPSQLPLGEKQDHHDHELELEEFTSYQYFLYRDIVASFKCFPVAISEVVFPSPQLRQPNGFNSSFHTCQLSERSIDDTSNLSYYKTTMKTLSEKTNEVLETIADCVNTMRTHRSSGTSDPITEESQSLRKDHFDEFMVQLSKDRHQLRDDIDSIHLIMQSVRIRPSEPSQFGVFVGIDEVVGEDENEELSLPEEIRGKLLLSILRLKCKLSNLVQVWNQRMEETNEKDRSGTWESRGRNSNSPSSTRRGITASHSSIPEDSHLEESNANSLGQALGESSSVGALNELEDSLPGSDGVGKMDRISVPPQGSFSRKMRASVSSSSSSSEKTSSYKKMSKTGSSVRLLVTRLLPGNTLIPSIPLPFPADEHYRLAECVSTNIVVRDAEPASIIAYALSCDEYRRFSKQIVVKSLSVCDEDGSGSFGLVEDENHIDQSNVALNQINKIQNFDKGEKEDEPDGLFRNSPSSQSLTPTNSPHIELQFSDSTAKFYCKVYFASQFERLRAKVLEGGEAQYLTSLARSFRWVARGGKSGSTFHKTRDDQFIMKQMSYFELQSFLEFAPNYISYVSNSIDNQEPTVLSKILGVYRVSFRNTETNRSLKQDVLVIENLFYHRKVCQIFDLKGSVRNRNVKVDVSAPPEESGCSGEHNDLVLLDENLIKLMSENPLYVHEHTKHLLKNSIARDTSFLSSHLIMDYSLLAGVDEDNQIIVGIIDYIRTFTWDKKLEMVVKSYGMIGGRKTSNRSMPTVVSPELYKNRFCEAMDRYFQVVPDRWYGMSRFSA